MSPRRKPCACQFGNWAKFAGLAQAAATVLFPHWWFFNVHHFGKLGGRQPPTAVVGKGRLSGAGRGGAPRRTRGAQPMPEKHGRRGAEHASLVLFVGGPAGPKLRVEFLLDFATCTTSRNVVIPYVENVLAVAGGGSAGPTSRGVIQLGS